MLESLAAVWEPRSHRRSAEMRIQTSSERMGAVALGIPAWEPTSSIRATFEGSFQSWDRLIVLVTLIMPHRGCIQLVKTRRGLPPKKLGPCLA